VFVVADYTVPFKNHSKVGLFADVVATICLVSPSLIIVADPETFKELVKVRFLD
jgi:hypothetical protein